MLTTPKLEQLEPSKFEHLIEGSLRLSMSWPLMLVFVAVDQFGLSMSWPAIYASRSVGPFDEMVIFIVLLMS
jgi:hypothetical protein